MSAWVPRQPPANASGPHRKRQDGLIVLIEAVHEAAKQPGTWGLVQHVYLRTQHASVSNYARSLRRGYLPTVAQSGETSVAVTASGKGVMRYLSLPVCEVLVVITDDAKHEAIYLRVVER